jgi:hypothetical protein
VGATTATTGAFTDVTTSGTVTHNAGTANGVAYLNGSKVLTTGSALTFDGANLSATGNIGTTIASKTVQFSAAGGSIFTSFADGTNTWRLGAGILGAGQFNLFDATNSQTTLGFVAGASGYSAFYQNNAEQMRLTSTGLGLGTSSPATKLDVRSGATPTAALLDTTAATAYSAGSFFSGANLQLRSGANATGNGAGIRFSSANNGSLEGMFGWVQNASTYGDFVWQSFNGSYGERMRLDSSGNLGLGVTPSAWGSGLKAIDIGNGSAIFNPGSSAQTWIYNNAYNNSGAKYKNSGLGASWYQMVEGAHAWYTAPSGTAGNAISFTQAMTLDASGNLGVGTTSPAVRFHIAGTGAPGLRIQDLDGTNQFGDIGCNGGEVSYVARNNTSNGAHVWYGWDGSTFSERARITSGGDLLVGKTSSSTATPGFEVRKVDATTTSLVVTTAGYFNALFNRQTDDGDSIIFQRQNSSVGSISVKTTLTSYNVTSDYRLKNTIAPMTGALARVALLKPCTYKWNVDGSGGEGFIAHELAEVVPHAVTGEKDAVDADGNPKHQGIDVSFLVATLTAAIQELKAEFDAYKASHP